MFQKLPFGCNFGYISKVLCQALLRAQITLLGRMSNCQKFGSLLTLTSWMVIPHKKKGQKQLTHEIKQFSDVLFCTYISKNGKEILLIKKPKPQTVKSNKENISNKFGLIKKLGNFFFLKQSTKWQDENESVRKPIDIPWICASGCESHA